MKRLKFRRIVIVSDSEGSGNQFEFRDSFNLITALDNSVGKSSLAKSLFWAFGCEPSFDEEWRGLECKVLVEAYIGEEQVHVLRTPGAIYLRNGREGQWRGFPKVTGEYSSELAEIVGFSAKLPNRRSDTQLEVPPPAYYFLPFYLDQVRSWSNPWDSFINLNQYSGWKPRIVKYHTGYLTPEYFQLEEEICVYEGERQSAVSELEKIDTALETVDKYVPSGREVDLSPEKFEATWREMEQDLEGLAAEKERLLGRVSKAQASKHQLRSQLKIAKRAVDEIEQDYRFTVENLQGDKVECPLCGTEHDNSIVSRASLLSDKSEAETHVTNIEAEIVEIELELQEVEPRLNAVRSRMAEVDERYRVGSSHQPDDGRNVIDSLASGAVRRNVEGARNRNVMWREDSAATKADLKKRQVELVDKKRKSELSEYFHGLLVEFVGKLGAKGIDLSKAKHPTDYNKLFVSGGAAESTRAVLAYQLAVYRQIDYVGNEISAPLVVDTPNQQEQALDNYLRIIELILGDTPVGCQVILCGMENPHLSQYKEKSWVIDLGEEKLLKHNMYEPLKAEIEEIRKAAVWADGTTR